jgi:UDP-N-acetylmuramyl-tripeptide synthetase
VLQHLHSAPAATQWLRSRVAPHGTLRTDSRQVQPGDGFVAWPGAATDGRRFVGAALQAGAAACLVEADGVAAFDLQTQTEAVATLPGLKAATGAIADAWFNHPSNALRVLAVTGTNGKTSTSWWLAQCLAQLGQPCGVVGTLGVGTPSDVQPTGLTTPDPVTLHSSLRNMVGQGMVACALEASSIGLQEERLAGLQVAVALFSNLTQDHLDYHGSMAAYGAAKRRLFSWPGLQAAVVNVDDSYGAALAQQLADQTSGPELWTVSATGPARLQASHVHHANPGLAFDVQEAGQGSFAVQTQLVGSYNASNLLLVLGGLRALGVSLAQAVAAVCQAGPVPGRMQTVLTENKHAHTGPRVVVDFAHTPDALDKALAALRPMAQARGGQLWCVVGCGGDRDPHKRPLMGAAAAQGAGRVVLTSDNPRSEDPAAIVAAMATGCAGSDTPVVQLLDRAAAIAHAITHAADGDVVLLAGKGHETTQEVAGVKHPFSDVLQAELALARRAAAAANKGAPC